MDQDNYIRKHLAAERERATSYIEGERAKLKSVAPSVLGKIDDRLTLIEKTIERKLEAPKPKWRKRVTFWLKNYLILWSAAGFMMFIGEESLQTTGFSCFGFIEAEDWTGLDQVCRRNYATILHWYCDHPITGVYRPWMIAANPILTPAYRMFCDASKAYLAQIETRIELGK